MIERSKLPLLRALSRRFGTTDAALSEIGHLEAVLTLPKGTVHVVSDVHGEHKKLKHIVNNASGSLRPFVESIFAGRLEAGAIEQLLALLYYPRESCARFRPQESGPRARWLREVIAQEVDVVRALSRRHSRRHVERTYPAAFASTIRELVASRDEAAGSSSFRAALVKPFLEAGRDVDLLRALAHVVRNLSIEELVVAGDLGDRGPRLDRVIDFLMRQRNVSIVWGNHDASWMGACLGHEALVATVVRLSLRYGRTAQLEEGYGISLAPVERLAREAYADDPATFFAIAGDGARDPALLARMHKAITVLQLKVEKAVADRRPELELHGRCLLHRIDRARGTIDLDGVTHPLRDPSLPTVSPAAPYALTEGERACLERMRRSFLESPILWQHMTWLERHGSMLALRDDAAIFHGCVPVDASGAPLSLEVDGERVAGRRLFDALEHVVRRAFEGRAAEDLDTLYYLWSGPVSPLFGKDRMTTFESYFLASPEAKVETKNPYFALLHDAAFCASILRELGADPERGLIVNGHVPVRPEKGESPLKRSGRAVTIDGAFSEAYGDRGYTLVLEAGGTHLAQHHHFESVGDAVERGADIIPAIQTIERHVPPRTVGDTETGRDLRHEIEALRDLARAYADRTLLEHEQAVPPSGG